MIEKKASSSKISQKKSVSTKTALNAAFKYTFNNRNYEALKKITEIKSNQRFYVLKAFFRSWFSVIALIVLLVVVFIAIIGPSFTQDPTFRDPIQKHLNAFDYDSNGVRHWLGTDLNGTDNLARLVHGLAFSIGLAAIATLVDIVIGVILGFLQGYYKTIDKYLQNFIKIAINLPNSIVLVLVALVLGPSFWTIVLGLTLFGWIPMANYVRGEIIKFKNEEFVIASRILGTRSLKIVTSLLPLVVPIILTQLLLTISSTFLGDIYISALGLGIPNTASIGNVFYSVIPTLLIYPLEVVWPILTTVIFLTSLNIVSGGITDSFSKVSR